MGLALERLTPESGTATQCRVCAPPATECRSPGRRPDRGGRARLLSSGADAQDGRTRGQIVDLAVKHSARLDRALPGREAGSGSPTKGGSPNPRLDQVSDIPRARLADSYCAASGLIHSFRPGPVNHGVSVPPERVRASRLITSSPRVRRTPSPSGSRLAST